MSVHAHRNTKSTGETEVSEFDDTLAVDEQVLRLQVPMENTTLVAEQNALQQLQSKQEVSNNKNFPQMQSTF